MCLVLVFETNYYRGFECYVSIWSGFQLWRPPSPPPLVKFGVSRQWICGGFQIWRPPSPPLVKFGVSRQRSLKVCSSKLSTWVNIFQFWILLKIYAVTFKIFFYIHSFFIYLELYQILKIYAVTFKIFFYIHSFIIHFGIIANRRRKK